MPDLLLILEALVLSLTLWIARVVIAAGLPPGETDWMIAVVHGPVDRATLLALALITAAWAVYRALLQQWADQVTDLQQIADRLDAEVYHARPSLRADLERALLQRLARWLREDTPGPGWWERLEGRLLHAAAPRLAPPPAPPAWILSQLLYDGRAALHRYVLQAIEDRRPDPDVPPAPIPPPRPLLHRLTAPLLRPLLHRLAWHLSRRNLDPLRSGPLRAAHDAFEQELIPLAPDPVAPDAPRLARPGPAARHFHPDSDSLPADLRPHWLLPTGQAVLLTLGILGTFTGLFLGLNDALPAFQAAMRPGAADAPATMSLALSDLLDGAQLAFSKSIAGLLFSLVYSWRLRQQEHRFEDGLRRVAAALDSRYPLRSHEHLLAALTDELRLARRRPLHP